MSTPAHFDSEIFLRINEAQSSRVPVPLSDDPYRAVRQSHLADTDTESGPLKDLRETKIPHPLLVVPSSVPSSDDLYMTVGQDHTPITIDIESEPKEAPLEIEEFQPLVSKAPLIDDEFEVSEPSDIRITSSHSLASSNFTAPLSPDHPLTQTSPTHTPNRASFHRRIVRMAVRTQPTLSPGMSARIPKAAALSPYSFRKRYRSSYETPSPLSSLTLPIRKRYQGTSELIEDTKGESSEPNSERDGSEDETSDSEEEEEAAPEGQHQAVLVEDTAMDEPLGLGYGALRRRELVVGRGEMPNTFEVGQSFRSVPEHEEVERVYALRQPNLVTWLSGSLSVSSSSPAVPTPIVSPVTTSATIIAVDKDEFLEVGVQLELHGSILHDHTQWLDALPPTLFEGYVRDLRELYTRSRAIRDDILS
uniref:Uncharacterized protein n=1 Tax=Tanacetum cinerariifolium TaxID=118510 RepID=A0A699ILW1_TANCI|nr:hypothetical protein [Tanacetum cinerariifolium]